MNTIVRTQFELEKIKILKNTSGVEIDFLAKKSDDAKPDHYAKECPNFPHPDLIQAINGLKHILFRAIGKDTVISERVLSGYQGLFKKPEGYEELEKALAHHYTDELTKITVTGIAVSGYESNRGAIITGTYLCKNGSKIAINSPRIRFASDTMGIEKQFEEACMIIEEEAFQYAINDKQAQQEIIFDNNDTAPIDEPPADSKKKGKK